MEKAQRLSKGEFLGYWRGLPEVPAEKVARKMRRVPYKHEGSTFDQDGIRITGTRDFIDALLGVLKPFLARENGEERLQVNYTEATDRATGRPMGTWTCYIQVHERGGEAKMVNAFVSQMTGRETIVSAGY